MQYWIIYLVVGLIVAVNWALVGRAILRGQWRRRGGGVLRRSESPVVFWLTVSAMLAGTVLAIVALFFVIVPLLQSHHAAKELEGAWEVQKVIDDGQPTAVKEGKGGKWVFTTNTVTMTGPKDPDGWVEGPDVMHYSLDPTASPRAMDLIYHPHPVRFGDKAGGTVEVERIHAIYKLEGDTLTIAMRPPAELQFQRPTQFEFEDGTHLSVVVLTRVKLAE